MHQDKTPKPKGENAGPAQWRRRASGTAPNTTKALEAAQHLVTFAQAPYPVA